MIRVDRKCANCVYSSCDRGYDKTTFYCNHDRPKETQVDHDMFCGRHETDEEYEARTLARLTKDQLTGLLRSRPVQQKSE